MFTILLSTFFLVVGFSADAFAWGPATHLEYASKALGFISLFPPMVKKLLTKHPNDYLYGSVAADITLGKGLVDYLYNCHNWKVALDIFKEKANEDHKRAFMLGYLSHLAADTVAHNFFVPFKLIRSWNTKLLKHVYWEMRMDLTVPKAYWELTGEFCKGDFEENDKLLESHLKRTLFSFKTNKKIFNGLLILQRMRQWKLMAKKMAENSQWELHASDVKMFKDLAQNSVIDFLTNFEDSYVLRADPTGKLKIMYARETVRKIKHHSHAGHLSHHAETRLLGDIKLSMKDGIYEQRSLPLVENYLV